jgi:mono/diheme cytochrome c family protein
LRKTNLVIALIFVLISVTFTVAFGANQNKGDSDRGRNHFRKVCKDCHTKGSAGGEVTPLTKTRAQWLAYFEKGKHARGTLAQVVSEQQLLDTRAYLAAHAADSEHPEICGR